jgi:hypothetical protein
MHGFKRGGVHRGPIILGSDEVPAVLKPSQARFTIVANAQLLPGDEVCIDTGSGLLRKANANDKWTFLVPEDAWQEGDKLCIPPNALLPRLRH